MPIYNEEESIPHLISALKKLQEKLEGKKISYEFLMIDDGSTDRSFELLQKVQSNSIFELYRHEKNSGQSQAILTGIYYSQGAWIAVLDSDLQSDPLDILTLFELKDSFDCIVARRTKREDALWKKILSSLSNRVRRLLINDGTLDSGSSLKLFKRECSNYLPSFKGVHRFLPAYFSMAGYRIGEKEIPHYPRKHGTTKYSFFSRGPFILFDFFATSWLFSRKTEQPDIITSNMNNRNR